MNDQSPARVPSRIPGTATPTGIAPAQPATAGDVWSLARLIGADSDGLCMVTSLTPLGARLVCVLDLDVGAPVVLDFGEERKALAHVRWLDDGVAGIEFAAPFDGARLAAAGAIGDRPFATPRFRRCAPAMVNWNGSSFAGELVEIGCDSARLRGPGLAEIPAGAAVTLRIEGLEPCEGRLCWAGPDCAGIVFTSTIQLWRLDKWLKALAADCRTCPAENCPRPSSLAVAPPAAPPR